MSALWRLKSASLKSSSYTVAVSRLYVLCAICVHEWIGGYITVSSLCITWHMLYGPGRLHFLHLIKSCLLLHFLYNLIKFVLSRDSHVTSFTDVKQVSQSESGFHLNHDSVGRVVPTVFNVKDMRTICSFHLFFNVYTSILWYFMCLGLNNKPIVF